MERIQSIDTFKLFQEKIKAGRDPDVPTIVIPASTCSQASGANDLLRITKKELIANGLVGKVNLRITGCHGFCQMEPNVLVEPRGTFYPKVDMDNMVRIVESVAKGEIIESLLFNIIGKKRKIISCDREV